MDEDGVIQEVGVGRMWPFSLAGSTAAWILCADVLLSER